MGRSLLPKAAIAFIAAIGLTAVAVAPAHASAEYIGGAANCGNYYVNLDSTSTGRTEHYHINQFGSASIARWSNGGTYTFRISAFLKNGGGFNMYTDMNYTTAHKTCDW